MENVENSVKVSEYLNEHCIFVLTNMEEGMVQEHVDTITERHYQKDEFRK